MPHLDSTPYREDLILYFIYDTVERTTLMLPAGCPARFRLRLLSLTELLWFRRRRSICSSALILDLISVGNTALFGRSWERREKDHPHVFLYVATKSSHVSALIKWLTPHNLRHVLHLPLRYHLMFYDFADKLLLGGSPSHLWVTLSWEEQRQLHKIGKKTLVKIFHSKCLRVDHYYIKLTLAISQGWHLNFQSHLRHSSKREFFKRK